MVGTEKIHNEKIVNNKDEILIFNRYFSEEYTNITYVYKSRRIDF